MTSVKTAAPCRQADALFLWFRQTTSTSTALPQSSPQSPAHISASLSILLSSVVLLEQIRTVNQNELGAYIGIVDDGDMLNTISNGLKKTLGMWRYQTARTGTRCLCGRCLQEYMDTRAYIISRLDPFQKQKDSCDRCGKPGFDYALKERTKRF